MRHDFNIAVFDLETGGLSPDKNPIVEVAFCPITKDLQDLTEYDTLIKPYSDELIIQPQALQANGLTMEEILGGKDSKIVIKELIDLFKSLKEGKNLPVLCGHNIIKFDIPFLFNFFEFHKQDLSKFVDLDSSMWFDTLLVSRIAWFEMVNYKLGSCINKVDNELIQAHRALPDTRATKELIKHFLRNLRGENNVVTEGGNKEKFREGFKI